jgi:hypothetical protein
LRRTAATLCLLIASSWVLGCATTPLSSVGPNSNLELCLLSPWAPACSAPHRDDPACSRLEPLDLERHLWTGCGRTFRCPVASSNSVGSYLTHTTFDLFLLPFAIAAAAAPAIWPPPCEAIVLPRRSFENHGPADSGLMTSPASTQPTTPANSQWNDEEALWQRLMRCERTGRLEEADRAWRDFLARPGAQPVDRLGYARWLVSKRRRREALHHARALNDLPAPPRGTASLLGQLLVDVNPADARARLERAVREDPEDIDAAEALATLSR